MKVVNGEKVYVVDILIMIVMIIYIVLMIFYKKFKLLLALFIKIALMLMKVLLKLTRQGLKILKFLNNIIKKRNSERLKGYVSIKFCMQVKLQIMYFYIIISILIFNNKIWMEK